MERLYSEHGEGCSQGRGGSRWGRKGEPVKGHEVGRQ